MVPPLLQVERSITRKAAVVSASKDDCKEMLGIMTKFSDTVAAIDGLTKKLTDNRLISRLLSFYRRAQNRPAPKLFPLHLRIGP